MMISRPCPIDDVSVAEGDSGTSTLTFTVTRSIDTSVTTTVNFATMDDTATAGTDYDASSDTLTFDPGDSSKTITIDVTGDGDIEDDETLLVQLSGPSGSAVIADGTGVGNHRK